MDIGKLLQRDVVTISPNAAVLEAARLMRAEHVGSVIAVDDQRRPIGVLTDRDIVVSVLAKDVEHLDQLSVKDVLSAEPVVTCRETDDLEAVFGRMRGRGIRRIPVVDKRGELIGIFAMDDLLELLATDLSKVVALIATQRRHEQRVRP